jgi:DNA-binding transcriptional LysR family regulator
MISPTYHAAMLQDVEIRQLRALQAVAAEGSFGRAAERLGFTQSAISQQIAALERAIGDRVFDRPGGPRRAELTPIGALVLAYADAVADRFQHFEDELQSLRAGEIGRLVVGSFQSVSVNVLPEVIGRLRAERPGLSVRCIESDDNDELIAKLLADELDLSFVVGRPDHDSIESIELLSDAFVAISPVSHGTAPVALDSLHGAPFIGEMPCACQVMIDEFLRAHGVEPDYVFRSNDNAAVQAMVRAGMGRAILPFLAVDTNDRGVAVTPLDPEPPPRVIALARRRDRTLIPAAQRFIELASAVGAALPKLESFHREAEAIG